MGLWAPGKGKGVGRDKPVAFVAGYLVAAPQGEQLVAASLDIYPGEVDPLGSLPDSGNGPRISAAAQLQHGPVDRAQAGFAEPVLAAATSHGDGCREA